MIKVTKYMFKDSQYTNEARELDNKTFKLMEPLMAEYINQGYCPRDIAHVMMGALTEVELTTILRWQTNLNKPPRSTTD